MKSNTQKDINKIIDEETKYVTEYFKEHNIPYHLENGIPIREDLPDEMELACLKCKGNMIPV